MMLATSPTTPSSLKGFSRTATEQALENLAQALRALELAPVDSSELCPHPLMVVRAEIENARRYLTVSSEDMQSEANQSARPERPKRTLRQRAA